MNGRPETACKYCWLDASRTPFICLCGPYPTILQIGAYCPVCQPESEDGQDEQFSGYEGDPAGNAYDRARDKWEESQG